MSAGRAVTSGGRAATSAFERYRRAAEAVPDRVLAWNVYGSGIESVGRAGAPEVIALGQPGPDQLLVRIDAVGLCFSDVKIIRQGKDHPKLYGRDLARDPTRLGHETSVTIMAMGAHLGGRFRIGQRLAIQPDIYAGGRSTAYGYTIPGGLIEYQLIGPEVLDADDGAYVIEVDDRLGYAETALTEPWACVEAAYTQRRRLDPLVGGRMLIVATTGDRRSYRFGDALAGPAAIVVGGGNGEVEQAVLSTASTGDVTTADLALTGDWTPLGTFDDIIMLAPAAAEVVSRAAGRLADRGVLNLVGDRPLDGLVEIDIGRLHYHSIAYVGTAGLDIAAGYGWDRNRAELRPAGVAVVVGAAGPMGQMHVERALGLPNGPRLVIAADLDADRLAAARARLMPVAEAHGRELVVEAIDATHDAVRQLLMRHIGDRRADDVVVTAPSARAVVGAAEALAPDGMLVLFAGVPVGTRAAIDLSPVYLDGRQYTGTSGSRISDQARVVDKSLAGELEPRRALAAVGGIEAAQDAIRALVDGRYPGKIVLFPNLRGLPLTSLPDLAATHPEVARALAPDGTWTREAEVRLFERHLAMTEGTGA